jgi:excisionase family DNA binding protein
VSNPVTLQPRTNQNPEDRLLALPEVARQLACSPGLVRRLGSRGVLPRVKLGRLVRYRASDVTRLVTEGVPRAA